MKNSTDTIGNRTRDLPACSAVPHPIAPPRALNHSLVKALIMSGSMPPIIICFIGVHRDFFIHIFIFNVRVKAIICKYTKDFIGFVFVIDSRHHLSEVGTEILNVLGELPEPGSLS